MVSFEVLSVSWKGKIEVEVDGVKWIYYIDSIYLPSITSMMQKDKEQAFKIIESKSHKKALIRLLDNGGNR